VLLKSPRGLFVAAAKVLAFRPLLLKSSAPFVPRLGAPSRGMSPSLCSVSGPSWADPRRGEGVPACERYFFIGPPEADRRRTAGDRFATRWVSHGVLCQPQDGMR